MKSGTIRREEGCLMIDEFASHRVLLVKCITNVHNKRKDQHKRKMQMWIHEKGGLIRNKHFNLCLTTEGLKSSDNLRAVDCNANDPSQIWWFQKYTDVDI